MPHWRVSPEHFDFLCRPTAQSTASQACGRSVMPAPMILSAASWLGHGIIAETLYDRNFKLVNSP